MAPCGHARIKARVGFIELHHLGLDDHAAAVGHGVPRVQAQIHQHLLDLGRIGFYHFERRGQHFEFNVLADHFVEKTDQSAGNGVEVNGLSLQDLAPRKSQQFARERRGPLRLFLDARKSLAGLCSALVFVQAQLRPSQDRTDDVFGDACFVTMSIGEHRPWRQGRTVDPIEAGTGDLHELQPSCRTPHLGSECHCHQHIDVLEPG